MHCAELGDAAHIVAGQVDQHDVLGDLFRVLAQLARHAPIVFFVAASTTCAGNRTRHDLALQQLNHRLGRRTHQGHLGMTQEVHIRTRVDLTKHAIHVERVGLQIDIETLRQHHLEHVASKDVLLGHFDGLLILTVGHRRSHRW